MIPTIVNCDEAVKMLLQDALELWRGMEADISFEDFILLAYKKVRTGKSVPLSKDHDPVNHPSHYTSHPSKIECIDIVKFFDFCVGNAVKYIWRHKEKGNPAEDLKKAIWYLQKELEFYEDKKSSQ